MENEIVGWNTGFFAQLTLTGEGFTTRCYCGKVSKNIRGLKIHQSKARWRTTATYVQCMDPGQVRQRRAPARKHTTVLKISMHLSHHSTSGLTKRTLLRSLNSPYQFVEEREGQQQQELHMGAVRRPRRHPGNHSNRSSPQKNLLTHYHDIQLCQGTIQPYRAERTTTTTSAAKQVVKGDASTLEGNEST